MFLALTLIFFTHETDNTRAQGIFLGGYIVDKQRDTIFGSILFNNEEENTFSCKFIKNGNDSTVTYSGDEILSYKFTNSNLYITKKYEGKDLFFDCFFKGKISLYSIIKSNARSYFIENEDNELIELSDEQKIVSKNGKNELSLPKYNNQLKIVFSNFSDLYPQIDQISCLSKSSLIRLAKLYQQKSNGGDNYFEYDNNSALKNYYHIAKKNSIKDFKPGFIITKQNDTIRGNFLDINNFITPKVCFFKRNSNEIFTQYYPEDIKAFRIQNGKFYISKIILSNGKIQIKGKANAYYRRDDKGEHYYIETENNNLVELTEEEQKGSLNNINYIKPEAYTGKLKYALSNSQNIQNDIDGLKLNHENLIKLLKDYHSDICDSTECLIYEKSKKPVIINLGVDAGSSITKFDFGRKLVSDNNLCPIIGASMKISNIFYDVENFFIQFGAEFHYLSNVILKINDNNTQNELITYHDIRYYVNKNKDLTVINDYNLVTKFEIDLKTLSLRIPMTFGYMFNTNKNFKPYLGAGLNSMIVLNQNKEFIYNSFFDEYGKSVPSTLFGYKIESGCKIRIFNTDILLQLAYNHFLNLNNINEFLRLNIDEFSLKIGYIF